MVFIIVGLFGLPPDGFVLVHLDAVHDDLGLFQEPLFHKVFDDVSGPVIAQVQPVGYIRVTALVSSGIPPGKAVDDGVDGKRVALET